MQIEINTLRKTHTQIQIKNSSKKNEIKLSEKSEKQNKIGYWCPQKKRRWGNKGMKAKLLDKLVGVERGAKGGSKRRHWHGRRLHMCNAQMSLGVNEVASIVALVVEAVCEVQVNLRDLLERGAAHAHLLGRRQRWCLEVSIPLVQTGRLRLNVGYNARQRLGSDHGRLTDECGHARGTCRSTRSLGRGRGAV